MRLGYACISMEMSSRGITCNRSVRINTIKTTGEAYLDELSLLNIEALRQIILYNESIGIRVFRITSSLFPHLENPAVDELLGHRRNIAFARERLAEVGELARGLGHRLTFHPDHFAQLGSPRPEIIARTNRDLNIHAEIFEYMGYTPELGSVMVMHGGGTYGDKQAAMARWEHNFQQLPKRVSRFICLENDEWQYSVMDLLPLCERNGIPLCIDFFHHEIGHSDQFDIFDEALLKRVVMTWRTRGIRPKCHWSNQQASMRKGTHADYIHDIPKQIMRYCVKYSVDMMCECKMKDRCVQRLLDKHFQKKMVAGRVEWHLRSR